jgi:hypothetical protein
MDKIKSFFGLKVLMKLARVVILKDNGSHFIVEDGKELERKIKKFLDDTNIKIKICSIVFLLLVSCSGPVEKNKTIENQKNIAVDLTHIPEHAKGFYDYGKKINDNMDYNNKGEK